MKHCKLLPLFLMSMICVFSFGACGGVLHGISDGEGGEGGEGNGENGTSLGEAFALKASVPDAEWGEGSYPVVFRLAPSVMETYLDARGKEQTRSIYLQIDDVYFFVESMEETPVEFTLRRSSSSNSEFFGGKLTATVSEQGVWVHPFTFTTNWQLSTYDYWEFSAAADVRVAEVLFVGRPASTVTEHNAERYIVLASIYSAIPDTGETAAEARERAGALLDAQPKSIPSVN